SEGADAIARGAMAIRDSTWVTEREIENAVARIYATGRFDQVSYRVNPRGVGREIAFDLDEGDRDLLGLGVRYETSHGASLLINATVMDWISPGSAASLTAR